MEPELPESRQTIQSLNDQFQYAMEHCFGNSVSSLRNIDYLQALRSSIVYCISCAAGLLCEVANAETAIIDQVTISLVHTAAIIGLGSIDNLIRSSFYPLVFFYVCPLPSLRLIFTGENKD